MKKFSFCLLLLLGIPLHWAQGAGFDPTLKKASDLTYNAKFSEAEAIINNYIVAHPTDPLGYIMRGTNNDWKQKIKNLREKLNETVLDDYKMANNHAFQQWDKDQANIEKMVNLGNSYLYVSKKWLDVGKKTRAGLILKKCQRHMETAIKKDSDRFDAYLAIGLFNFYAANLPSGLQFLASFLGISGNEPKGLDMMTKAATQPNLFQNDALFMLTYAYGNTKKKYGMAQNYLRQLIARYPENPYFLLLRGEYSFKAKAFDQAKTDMNALLNFCGSKPDSCVPLHSFTANYVIAGSAIERNNISEATPFVEKAVSLNENQYADKTVALHLYQGLVAKMRGKKEEAIVEFQKAIDSREKNSQAASRAKRELQSIQ